MEDSSIDFTHFNSEENVSLKDTEENKIAATGFPQSWGNCATHRYSFW
jgi:hypothetical protein